MLLLGVCFLKRERERERESHVSCYCNLVV